jgi:hypothetical protein
MYVGQNITITTLAILRNYHLDIAPMLKPCCVAHEPDDMKFCDNQWFKQGLSLGSKIVPKCCQNGPFETLGMTDFPVRVEPGQICVSTVRLPRDLASTIYTGVKFQRLFIQLSLNLKLLWIGT